MAENKKSFVLYADLLKSIEHLTNEEKGILFNHLLEYVNDKNPVLTDRLILTAWKPIELQLKRDLHEWEVIKVDRSKSGVLGNLKRWNLDLYDKVVANEMTLQDAEIIAKSRKTSHPDNPSRKGSQGVANIAVNVTDTVTVNDTVNVTVTESEIITPESRAQISSTHLNEFQKISIDDCRKKYDVENVNLRNDLGAYLHIKPDEVIILHNNFDLMLKTKEPEKQYNDYTRHFSNWARKLPPDELKQKIKPTQAVFMRPEQIKTDSSKYEDYYWNPNLKKA